ncbi:MAG: hypothetical protein LBQ59_03930 [Candidatus Peribacteria bacterium]|nr:hypothetical protein [Candidatus Peribacteria bacterium]
MATGSIGVYTSQIKKSRDSTRITSIGDLRTAVEQFYQDASRYPSTSEEWI